MVFSIKFTTCSLYLSMTCPLRKVGTTQGLDLCPDFMDTGCGGAGLISISNFTKNSANFSRFKCWKFTIRMRQLISHREKWNEYNFRVNTMTGQGIFISYPYDLGKAGGHRSKVEVMVAMLEPCGLAISGTLHWPSPLQLIIDMFSIPMVLTEFAVNDKLCFVQMSFSNIS